MTKRAEVPKPIRRLLVWMLLAIFAVTGLIGLVAGTTGYRQHALLVSFAVLTIGMALSARVWLVAGQRALDRRGRPSWASAQFTVERLALLAMSLGITVILLDRMLFAVVPTGLLTGFVLAGCFTAAAVGITATIALEKGWSAEPVDPGPLKRKWFMRILPSKKNQS